MNFYFVVINLNLELFDAACPCVLSTERKLYFKNYTLNLKLSSYSAVHIQDIAFLFELQCLEGELNFAYS